MSDWPIPPVRCKLHRRPIDLPGEPAEYLRGLANANRPFFLDSAAKHPRWGRFSYLGCNPLLSLTLTSPGPCRLEFGRDLADAGRVETVAENPWRGLNRLCGALRSANLVSTDQFGGGLVGYFAYDLGRYVERLPKLAKDDIALPGNV